MRFGFLKCLFVTLFALFASSALADDEGKGGGGQQQQQQQNQQQQNQQPTHITMTREEYDRLVAGQNKKDDKSGGGDDDDPLRDKVRRDREARERADSDAKTIEQVIAFTMGLDDFVKKNADLLPSEIGEIVKAANAEKYETASAKAAAVKKSIIDCYFSVQANVDCLTTGQKRELEDYQKLTKNGKEEKAGAIYSNIFEPCLEMNRRLAKAAELQRSQSGVHTSSGTEAAYRDKIIAAATKKYLGK